MHKAAFILLWIYVFTLPWDNILQFGDPIGSVGRVAGLLALAGCIFLVSATGTMRRLRAFHIAAAAYLGIVMMSIFWTADPQYTAQAIRTYLQSIMAVWLIWELASSETIMNLAVAYLAGAWIGAISVLRSFSTTTLLAKAKEARFTPDGWNSNDIALALALAIPFALYFAARRTNWATKCLACGYLILGPMAIVLTSSRGGLAVMAIAMSALPLYFRRRKAAAKLLMALVLVSAGCLAWHFTPAQSWDRLSTIYSSIVSGDLNSRELIWQSGLRTFSSNCLVGVGAGAFRSGAGSLYNAHNTFLAVLVEQGLLGFSVFSVIIGFVILSVARLNGEERMMCVFLLLCWGVGVFTLGWAMNRVTWFVLGFIVACAHAAPDAPFREAESAGSLAESAVGAA
jgi:O-antigen ligase